jgi:hypothetical protein
MLQRFYISLIIVKVAFHRLHKEEDGNGKGKRRVCNFSIPRGIQASALS